MIPVFRPSLDSDAVWRELRPVIASGWLGMGPKVEELERRLAAEVRAKYFIATSSCTAALHLAVKSLNLPEGSRVLTSPITFVSTNAALLWERLEPVFGRVDPQSGHLIDEPGMYGTAAGMVVHLGGARAPVGSARVPVIEDCAHAFGAPWLTEQGDSPRCWSFHAVKNLPMGDGGGVSTNDPLLAERLRRLRWFGISKSTHARSQGGAYSNEYEIRELGFKYHMNDVTAAVGLAALPSIQGQNLRRWQIAERYASRLADHAPCYRPMESACHFYPLFFENRDAVEQRLRGAGIGFSRHYQPNFLYPAFAGFDAPGRDNAMAYWDRVLVLPIFPAMTDAEVDQVIAAVRGDSVSAGVCTEALQA